MHPSDLDNPHFARARATLDAWTAAPASMPNVSGTFECHIFCAPLQPDPETRDRFVRACERAGVKALCLGLDYAGRGVVNVLQSTRYYDRATPGEVVALMLRDARVLAEDLEVVRLKLEAMAWNPGVPVTDRDARALPPHHYFEYHLKLDAPVSDANDAALKRLARELTRELGVPVPFSCNNLGQKNQRFLNARTYGLGGEASDAVVARITAALDARGFRVGKVIREFIVFDTNTELDRGWLEF